MTVYALIAGCGGVGVFGSLGCGYKAFGAPAKRVSSETFDADSVVARDTSNKPVGAASPGQSASPNPNPNT